MIASTKFAHSINLASLFLDDIPFNNQTALVEELNSRIKKKVQLFDDSFGKALQSIGPTYSTYPGITTCDPPPLSADDPKRNYVFPDSYIKLTNFIKVTRIYFVSF